MSRRKARETAFKVLFQVDQVKAEPRQSFEYLLAEAPMTESESAFSWTLVEGCMNNLKEIDEKIARSSNEWAIDRMSSVDRNLMRIAAYEILFIEDASPVVAINEAIEMSKRYGEENSASFVNAILDRIKAENEQA